MSENHNEKNILDLKNKIANQQKVITATREFFSSNSKFIKLYRKNSHELYPEMEALLEEQKAIFQKLESMLNSI